MPNEVLKRAIEIVGSQQALAARIGTSQSQISYWLNKARKRTPPAEFVAAIEAATNGAISRYELRPDLYGAAPAAPRLVTTAEGAAP